MTYSGYEDCCKRWDKVRESIDLSAGIARIQANIDAHPGPCDLLKFDVEHLRDNAALSRMYRSEHY